MSNKEVCKLCQNVRISTSVTFNGTNVVINIPAGSYENNHNYCIIVAQSIPSTAVINSGVVITIGSGTVQYPVVKSDCSQLTACGLASRTKYPMRVETTPTGGVFRLLARTCCVNRNLSSINGTAPVTTSTASTTTSTSASTQSATKA
jgi:hypothetical protein